MKKIMSVVVAVVMMFMAGMFVPASAHTPSIGATCNGVTLKATAYDGSKANKWTATVGGQTTSGTFGESLDKTIPVPQGGATTSWSASIEAFDGSYHQDKSGSVGPCGTPDKPQPVVKNYDKTIDNCELGGYQTTHYTETTDWVLVNNKWVPGETATTTTVDALKPYTTKEKVDKGCIAKPVKPEPVVVNDSSTVDNCELGGYVTTRTVTTTDWVYNETDNVWVKTEPVTTTSTDALVPYTKKELIAKGCVKVTPPPVKPPVHHVTHHAPVKVAAKVAPVAKGVLPNTGGPSAGLLGGAAFLLLVGGAMVFAGSKR